MKRYAVSYQSAGCLPDSEPLIFAEFSDAVDHVYTEYEDTCHTANYVDGLVVEIASKDEIASHMGIDDPRPNSLYRWSIEPYYGEV